jgi:8-oxo-dGTP pyrophosphatase MutT (NUDIX family)
LRRHLRKGRLISTWEAEHIPARALGMIAEDIARGVLIDTAVERAQDICLKADVPDPYRQEIILDEPYDANGPWLMQDTPAVVSTAPVQWPGWERDLGLVGAYKVLIGLAFRDAEARGSGLRKKAATGAMFVSNATLRDLISDEVREVFSAVLTPLWTEAWHLGYVAAESLVTGQPADFSAKHDDSEALAGFIAGEGGHWLSEIARTGLGNGASRADLIARTEVGRAIASAAIQCYRDHGVTHKHLLLSPGACEMCQDVAEDGDIPLDAPFSAGGVTGQCHPGDRCVPGPSWADVEPPLADLGKSAPAEDGSRVAWVLIRARDDDGKWRYLLQQRDDGTWGMPGGKAHAGEAGWAAAIREAGEEIGTLPPLTVRAVLDHVDPDGVQVHLYLAECPFFTPLLNGSTPQETAGTGWFRRGEAGALSLAPKFRDDWDHVIADCLDGLKKDTAKAAAPLQRMVNENGEVLTLTPASAALQAVGSRWPYPHRADGTEDPEMWPDAGPGAVPDEHGSAGGEPPNRINDFSQHEPHADIAPRGSDDGKMPGRGRKPNPPASDFPDQGSEDDEAWPQQPQTTLTPGLQSAGAGTGIPPSGASKNDSGHPVVGTVPPKTPEPYKPHSVPPETFDPAEAVEDWSPEAGSDVVHGKGAAQVTDANPVEWRHVHAQLEGNFPDSALEWVRHSTWVGPVNVPWSRIDDDDMGKWAAGHEPGAVDRFAREIARGGAHTNPSVVFHQANHPDGREIIGDGHHRAMARHFRLGRPVLAYVGTVPARWMPQALEMHSSQIRSGSDPGNA